jgi:hypothetical protein
VAAGDGVLPPSPWSSSYQVLTLLAPRVDPAALNIRSASAQRQRLLAAARGLLSGLKEDVGHLATELAERAAAAGGGGGGRQGSLGLHPVPEEGPPSVDDQVGGQHSTAQHRQGCPILRCLLLCLHVSASGAQCVTYDTHCRDSCGFTVNVHVASNPRRSHVS